MISRRNLAIGICGSMLASNMSNAQGVPRASELMFVVPAAAGGSADISGRLLARGITSIQTTPIIISNRSAGQGIEGTLYVFNSPVNSGNVLVGGPNGLFFAPARENLPYNADSFDPVCMFSMAAFVLVTRVDNFNNIDELMIAMQTRRINFAFSAADGRYLIDRFVKHVNARDTVAVSYRGGGEAVRDVFSGVVDVAITSLASVVGGIQSGTLRLLAHTLDSGNVAAYPNLPGLSDVLQNRDPALTSFHWHGLYLPKGSPQNLNRFLQNATRMVYGDSTFVAEHISRGMIPRYMNPDQLREHHAKMEVYMIGYNNWIRENGSL